MIKLTIYLKYLNRNMRKFWIIPCLLIILSCTFIPVKDEGNEYTAECIIGENYTVLIAAPEGWIVDTKEAKSKGVKSIFLPKRKTFKEAEAVIIVNFIKKGIKGTENIEIYLESVIKDYKNEDASLIIIEPKEQFLTAIKKKAHVRLVSNEDKTKNVAVALVDESEFIVELTLFSKEEIKKYLPCLKETLSTYFCHYRE